MVNGVKRGENHEAGEVEETKEAEETEYGTGRAQPHTPHAIRCLLLPPPLQALCACADFAATASRTRAE